MENQFALHAKRTTNGISTTTMIGDYPFLFDAVRVAESFANTFLSLTPGWTRDYEFDHVFICNNASSADASDVIEFFIY